MVKIPENAVIPNDKIVRCLLVQNARNDKSAFLAQAGFTSSNPEVLKVAIARLVSLGEAVEHRKDNYGVLYQVAGKLVGVNGTNLSVVTIWLYRQIDGTFQFVTLKPFKELHLYQEVALTRDFPDYELRAGDIATVVDFVPHPNGGEDGCVLEVFNAVGESLKIITVPVSTVEVLRSDEVLTNNQAETSPIQILESPSQDQIQAVAEWLVSHPHQNPDLEMALHLILRGQIVPHERGGLVAIAHCAAIASDLIQSDIQGVVMAKPGNANVSIASSNGVAAEALLSIVLSRGCPQRLCTSGQTKVWIRPLLLEHYQLQREHDQHVLLCTQSPEEGTGRWAVPQDKPILQAYAAAYSAERGSGRLDYPWDNWIQQRRIAVLEHDGQVVSVVRQGETVRHAIVVAPFTFPQFRRQGFARRLLAFFTREMLREFSAVKLWVDQENRAAIALYQSLNFQSIGTCYTGYFVDRVRDR